MILVFRPKTVLTVLIAFLLSCGITQTTGGGGTETVNTYAVLSNGTPASGAVVRIIDENGWFDSLQFGTSAVIESTVADKDGRFALRKHDNYATVNVQIDYADQGYFASGKTRAKLENDTLRLDQYASYAGSFHEGASSFSSLFLAGSAYRAALAANGSFNFSKVAPGPYALLGIDKSSSSPAITTCGGITLESGIVKTDTALNGAADRMLLDNFETNVGPTSLGTIFPGKAHWYAVTESGTLSWDNTINAWTWALHSATNPPPLSCQSSIAVTAGIGAAGAGMAMEFSVVLDSNCNSAPYATAGISFRPFVNTGIDLSAMQSFSLKVRGNGVIWVRFESKVLDSISRSISDYTIPITLTSSWQNLQIPIDSLRVLPALQTASQYPWSTESKNIIDVEFEFSRFTNAIGDTLHLYLDDFYLNGVGLDVLKQ